MTHAVLLLLNFIPEPLKAYLIEATLEEAKVLKKANGKYVNGHDEKEAKYASWVLAACDKNKENWGGCGIPEDWLLKDWHTKELDLESRPKVPASTVIQTGMFC